MARYLAGTAAVALIAAAGFLLWNGSRHSGNLVPAAPAAAAFAAIPSAGSSEPLPSAPDKTREERRFARYDADENGSITRAEMMDTRRKAYAKLDVNGDGRLTFEEWAVATAEKFGKADADKSGALDRAEFLTTKRETKVAKCAC